MHLLIEGGNLSGRTLLPEVFLALEKMVLMKNYWLTRGSKFQVCIKVYRMFLLVLLDFNINPDGVAWDCTTSKLYWTDVGDHDIEVLDPATGHRKVLIETGNNSAPRAIVLDCKHRFDIGNYLSFPHTTN